VAEPFQELGIDGGTLGDIDQDHAFLGHRISFASSLGAAQEPDQ
jgi:hypothetical protein